MSVSPSASFDKPPRAGPFLLAGQASSLSPLPIVRPAAFHLSFTCDLPSAREASRSVCRLLAAEGLHGRDFIACELALTEACNNAVLYAAACSHQEPLEVNVLCSSGWLEIHVVDHTPGFDWPAALVLPAVEAEQGRGLFIIDSLMDEVRYLRGCGENRLVMRKLLTARNQNPLTGPGDPASSTPSHASASGARDNPSRGTTRLSALPGGLAHELEIARKIQQSLLPTVFPPLPGLTMAAFCRSAQQVGGDFYDVLPLTETSALLVVADVMGKGVPAALFAATLRSLLRTTAEWTSRPGEVLERINRLMFHELSAVDMFITVQLALVDVRRRSLTIANAGHCPLLLAVPDGSVHPFAPDGVPVGILPHALFAETTTPLQGGCTALLYTDGLTEARNLEGEFFGQERLTCWLQRNARHNGTASRLVEDFKAELHAFQSDTLSRDDQTLLLLQQDETQPSLSPRHLLEALPVLAPLSSRKRQ